MSITPTSRKYLILDVQIEHLGLIIIIRISFGYLEVSEITQIMVGNTVKPIFHCNTVKPIFQFLCWGLTTPNARISRWGYQHVGI